MKKQYKQITIQITGDCNLACTYCFQHNKQQQYISFEDAKKLIDVIVQNDQSFLNGYAVYDGEDPIVLDLTGGEPFLKYDLVIKIVDYFKEACEKFGNEKLYNNSIISIGSNGTIYNQEIEDMFKRHKGHIGIAITVDGCRELHDKCRVFKNSNAPSYDIVVKNLEKFRKLVPVDGTKITISPENLDKLSDSLENLISNLKYKQINANCVFEDVWTLEDAKKLYQQLKKCADYILKNYEETGKLQHFSFFSTDYFRAEENLDNCWCGGNGKMLYLQYDGQLFNCSRYSEVSTGKGKTLPIGDIKSGITNTKNVCLMKNITREKYYDDECKKCPVARGCADCLGYIWEMNGNFDSKIKSICDMHKARSLANVYFWNKYYLNNGIRDYFLMWLPIDEIVKYVGEDETNMLLEISNNRFYNDRSYKEELKNEENSK